MEEAQPSSPYSQSSNASMSVDSLLDASDEQVEQKALQLLSMPLNEDSNVTGQGNCYMHHSILAHPPSPSLRAPSPPLTIHSIPRKIPTIPSTLQAAHASAVNFLVNCLSQTERDEWSFGPRIGFDSVTTGALMEPSENDWADRAFNLDKHMLNDALDLSEGFQPTQTREEIIKVELEENHPRFEDVCYHSTPSSSNTNIQHVPSPFVHATRPDAKRGRRGRVWDNGVE